MVAARSHRRGRVRSRPRSLKPVQLAESTRPDLAIFDVRLAGHRDGIEGAAILRERLGLPAVFVTAEGDPATRERASKAGAVSYLDKPVQLPQLISVIETALGRNST
jgi:CheY-like chemotaxis protein